MINLILRLIGFGKAVDALNGETSKAYLGGLVKILSGAGSVAAALANIVGVLHASHSGADILSLGQSLVHGDANTALLVGGAGLIGAGISAIGQRHALATAETSEIAPK